MVSCRMLQFFLRSTLPVPNGLGKLPYQLRPGEALNDCATSCSNALMSFRYFCKLDTVIAPSHIDDQIDRRPNEAE